MRVILTVTRGPRGAGQTFTFEEHATFLVGRSRRAHFRLPSDRYSSRIHFLIEVNPPSCRLSDLGSRNGTRVNGGKVETCDLRDGDAIEVGHTTLRVTVEAVAEGEPPTPPPSAIVPPPRPARSRPVGEGCPACGSALAGATGSPLCPACAEKAGRCEQAIPGYRLIEKLGGGAMGVVHLALDPHGEAVAVKTIKPGEDVSPAQVRRFLREAHVVHALDHPHVVKFFDRGEAGGKLYFAMEYVRGTDAARMLRDHGPAPPVAAVRLTCQLLEALAYAHGRGFVHRDIKPANLLLRRDGSTLFLKLADFGLARVYQESKLSGLTLMGDVGGTVPFMAPEQVSNFREAGPAADQYAAAAALYNLLTGAYPHDLAGLDMLGRLRRVLKDRPVPLRRRQPKVPAALAEVIHRALAREPARRFADVTAFREALLGFLRGSAGP